VSPFREAQIDTAASMLLGVARELCQSGDELERVKGQEMVVHIRALCRIGAELPLPVPLKPAKSEAAA